MLLVEILGWPFLRSLGWYPGCKESSEKIFDFKLGFPLETYLSAVLALQRLCCNFRHVVVRVIFLSKIGLHLSLQRLNGLPVLDVHGLGLQVDGSNGERPGDRGLIAQGGELCHLALHGVKLHGLVHHLSLLYSTDFG